MVIVAIAFLFSGAVGIFFGFYPAKKAASFRRAFQFRLPIRFDK
jgi:hypothetical protein